jgi:hypothetical protein
MTDSAGTPSSPSSYKPTPISHYQYSQLARELTEPQLTPPLTTARTNERVGLGATLAVVYASDGRGVDGPRLDAARGVSVSRATLAPSSRTVRGAEREEREMR